MIRRGLCLVLLALLAGTARAGRGLLQTDASVLTTANCECGTEWVKLLIKHGFGDALGPNFRGTVFVPCDKAVAAMPKLALNKIKATLRYHIIPAESGPVEYLAKESPLPTLWQSAELEVQCGDKNMVSGYSNSAYIIRGPVEVCAGATVICIDTVLIPPPPPPKPSPCYEEVAIPCSPVVVPPPPKACSPVCPPIEILSPRPCPQSVPSPCPVPSPCKSPECPLPAGYVSVSIWNIVESDPRMKLLAQLLELCGLKEKLFTMSKATFFAPTDAAIVQTLLWLNVTQEQLFANKDVLKQILAYHVVPGLMLWEDEIVCGTPSYRTMLNNTELTLHGGAKCCGTPTPADGDVFVVEGDLTVANVIEADIHGDMVLVHAIDFMLLPSQCSTSQLFNRSYSISSGPLPLAQSLLNPCNMPPNTFPWYPTVKDALEAIPCLSMTRDLFRCIPKLYALASDCNAANTFFLPTNAAWAKLSQVAPGVSVQQLMACGSGCADGLDILREQVLKLHILYKQYVVLEASLPATKSFTSMLYQRVDLTHRPGTSFFLNAFGSTAVAQVLNANNGGGRSLYNIIDNVCQTDFSVYYGAPADAPLGV